MVLVHKQQHTRGVNIDETFRCRLITYRERLNATNLDTLEFYRRLHSDLTMCYKIMFGLMWIVTNFSICISYHLYSRSLLQTVCWAVYSCNVRYHFTLVVLFLPWIVYRKMVLISRLCCLNLREVCYLLIRQSFLLPSGRAIARTCRYCFYSRSDFFGFFAPQGRSCTD